MVEKCVGTRTGAQIRSHAQKYYNKIAKGQSGSNAEDYSSISAIGDRDFSSVSNEKSAEIRSFPRHQVSLFSSESESKIKEKMLLIQKRIGEVTNSLRSTKQVSLSELYNETEEIDQSLRLLRDDIATKPHYYNTWESLWNDNKTNDNKLKEIRNKIMIQDSAEEAVRCNYLRSLLYFH